MPRTLIDGDSIAYRCAASILQTKTKEAEPDELAIRRLDEITYRILETTQADSYVIYLSGEENFRKILVPSYKANRVGPRPPMLDPAREFLCKEWNAVVCSGYEADDGIGIGYREGDIIAANDKDFRQIAGDHYHFVKDTFEVVDEDTADLNFWMQMLIGDRSDNVPGVTGIGPINANRHLSGLSPEWRKTKVEDLYGDRERFLQNYLLLRLLRSEEEYENIINPTSVEGEVSQTSEEV